MERLIEETFQNSLQKKLYLLKETYQLTNYEFVNLNSLILTNLIITRKAKIDEHLLLSFIKLIINHRQDKIVNNNSEVYNNAILIMIQNYFKEYDFNDENIYLLLNNWFNGYQFHSLNDCFVNNINDNGFILNDKPWDITEIKSIKKLLGKKIFGPSNAESNNIFFANELKTSPYYGLTSPTFFRKIIENQPQYLNIFLNRDINTSYQSMLELCKLKQLNEEETKEVINFFKKYWLIFATEKLPSVILKKRQQTNITIPSNLTIDSLSKMIASDNKVSIINEDLSRSDLIIFSYNNLQIVKEKQKRNNI